jgi:hypothetical protein
MIGNAYRKNKGHTPEACAAISAAHKGKPKPAEMVEKMRASMLAKQSDHHTCVTYCFKAPDGKIIEGSNILSMIRTNADLFDPDDVTPKPNKPVGSIRAANGLYGLRNNARMESWKGWTLA